MVMTCCECLAAAGDSFNRTTGISKITRHPKTGHGADMPKSGRMTQRGHPALRSEEAHCLGLKTR
jgi:hypothetical protein